MKYHFKKCKHLHIGNHDINFDYTMQTDTGPIVVEKVTSEKDLGVAFDQKLKFTEHINNKVNKANRNVGLIFRTFTFMNKEMFLNLYKSIVRPHLEYASSVWSPMFKKDKILIENVQRRATLLVKSIKHLPYEDRLTTLGLPSLENRRGKRSDMIQEYKILHGIDRVDKDKFFTLNRLAATRGHSFKLYKKRSRLMVRANCFSNRVVDTWNSLTKDIVKCTLPKRVQKPAKPVLLRTPVHFQSILLRTRALQRIWNTKPECIKRGQLGLISSLHRYIRYIRGI